MDNPAGESGLAEWINPAYLRASTIRKAQQAFGSSRPLAHLQAKDVLHSRMFQTVARIFYESDLEFNYVPHLHSFYEATSPKNLHHFNDLKALCRSEPFQRLLSLLTGLDLRVTQLRPVQFCWKDYTVLNDSIPFKPGIDIFLDVSDPIPADAGGEIVYLTKHEELVRITPCPNALTIIPRPKGVMRYVKYVNHKIGEHTIRQVWLSGG